MRLNIPISNAYSEQMSGEQRAKMSQITFFHIHGFFDEGIRFHMNMSFFSGLNKTSNRRREKKDSAKTENNSPNSNIVLRWRIVFWLFDCHLENCGGPVLVFACQRFLGTCYAPYFVHIAFYIHIYHRKFDRVVKVSC